MSTNDEGMTLGEMITALEQAGDGTLVRGLTAPHSYRGYYDRLALEPSRGPMTVAEVLGQARWALGRTFLGYKGGEYTMGESTLVHVASYGCTGIPLTAERLDQMLAARMQPPPIGDEIMAKARAASGENAAAMQAAILALLDCGVAMGDIEVASIPSRGPGAWVVRKRPETCVCGRAVFGGS